VRPDEVALLGSVPGAMVSVDDRGTITFATPEALQLLAWGPDLVGMPLTSIVPPRLRMRHKAGFARYVGSGQSNLQGSTVRVPAMRGDGAEVELDLTIRVFRRPDGSKLVSAALHAAPLGRAPEGLLRLEDELQKRLYQVI
jgi:PAS domain S-box-containing protein